MYKPANNKIQFILFFLLYNSIVLIIHFSKDYMGDRALSVGTLIHPWASIQYFFTYFNEFSKRALVGTFFNIFQIDITYESIFIFSIIVINLFFILFYLFSKKVFEKQPAHYFTFFMLLFILSPAVAAQRGLHISFLDNPNLLLTLIMIIAIIKYSTKINMIIVPLLSTIAIFIHEAFILINTPLILSIIINEIKDKKHTWRLLYIEISTVIFASLMIYLFGKVDQNTLENVRLLLPDDAIGPASDAFKIWTRSITDNFEITQAEYRLETWKTIFPIFPLLLSYIYLVASLLHWTKMTWSQKLVAISPLGILPLYLIAHDFVRFIALFIILLFVVFIYLLRDTKVYLKISKVDKIIIFIIFAYSFFGPLGVMTGFPYVNNFENIINSI
ncbi:hypothetical protein MNB_SV-6-774 [hydrothermal vent metagenome]|uniref:Glycosyltransferase RgtA/B/C/D-like domain-containing protein n=1 Tax=hydrothermal vent metagenome TaxID=652676 RepID=A0A1W1BDD5_9ZZZZ